MTERVTTLIDARRGRLERLLGHQLRSLDLEAIAPLSDRVRTFLREEAEDLYWNELEWENITDEEAMDEGELTELIFPGFLAFIRGLLLTEVMPDALAPASPRPQVVEDILAFLGRRVVELEDGLAKPEPADEASMERNLELTNRLIDLVLYRYHGLTRDEIESIEAGRQAPA